MRLPLPEACATPRGRFAAFRPTCGRSVFRARSPWLRARTSLAPPDEPCRSDGLGPHRGRLGVHREAHAELEGPLATSVMRRGRALATPHCTCAPQRRNSRCHRRVPRPGADLDCQADRTIVRILDRAPLYSEPAAADGIRAKSRSTNADRHGSCNGGATGSASPRSSATGQAGLDTQDAPAAADDDAPARARRPLRAPRRRPARRPAVDERAGDGRRAGLALADRPHQRLAADPGHAAQRL